MAIKKSILKGVIWEVIGVASMYTWTGDWRFSLAWVTYRVVTFPFYERAFKYVRRHWFIKKADQRTNNPGSP